jgi:hypothetical protein
LRTLYIFWMGKSITFWLNPLVTKCQEIELCWLYYARAKPVFLNIAFCPIVVYLPP